MSENQPYYPPPAGLVPGPRFARRRTEPATWLMQTNLAWMVTLFALYFGFRLDGWLHLLPWAAIVTTWVWRFREDVSHPCFWFPLVFTLYGVSFYILVQAGLMYSSPNAELATRAHLLALVAFIAAASRGPIGNNVRISETGIRYGGILLAFLLTGLAISAFHYLGVLSHGDLASKQDIRVAKDQSLALRLAPIYGPLAVAMGLWICRLRVHGSLRSAHLAIGFFIFWGVLGLIITGERDILLRTVVVVGFIWNSLYSRLRPGLVLASLAVIIIVLPVMQALKSVALSQFVEVRFDLYGFLGGEFKSSGRTFTVLLDYWPGFMSGETLIWDIKRTLSIGPFNPGVISTSEWFNRYFIGHDGAGWGFSLVGELYLNFGMVGVGVGFLVIGLLAHFVYSMRRTNFLWLVGYSVFVPSLLYSIRGDLSALFGSPLKLIVAPLMLVFVLERIQARLARVSGTFRWR